MNYLTFNFTGPQATHTLIDPEGRDIRQHYLLEAADDLQATPGPSASYRPLDPLGWTAAHYRKARRELAQLEKDPTLLTAPLRRKCFHYRSCRKMVSAEETLQGCTVCRWCRARKQQQRTPATTGQAA